MVATTSAATQASEMEKKRRHTLERARANHLSRQLQMRLQYAKLKVEHGWQKQTLNEVENLYFHHSHVQHRGPAKPPNLPTISSSISVITTTQPQNDHAILTSKANIDEQMQVYRTWLNSVSSASGSSSAMDIVPDSNVTVTSPRNRDGTTDGAQSSQSNVMEGVQSSVISAFEKTNVTAISPESVIPASAHDSSSSFSVVPSVAPPAVACPQPQPQSPCSKSTPFSSSLDFSINNFTPAPSSNIILPGVPFKNTESPGITTASNTNTLTATATTTPFKSGTRKYGTLGTPSSPVMTLNRAREELFGSGRNIGSNGSNVRSNNNTGTGANGTVLTYDSFWSNHVGVRTFSSGGKGMTGSVGAGHGNSTSGLSSGPSSLTNSLLNKSPLGLSSSSPSVRSASPAKGINAATTLAPLSMSKNSTPTSMDVRHEAMDSAPDTSKSTPPSPANTPPPPPVINTPLPGVPLPLSKPSLNSTFDDRLFSVVSPLTPRSSQSPQLQPTITLDSLHSQSKSHPHSNTDTITSSYPFLTAYTQIQNTASQNDRSSADSESVHLHKLSTTPRLSSGSVGGIPTASNSVDGVGHTTSASTSTPNAMTVVRG